MNNALRKALQLQREPLPQALLSDTGVSFEEAGHALVRAFVLSLYRRDRISSAKAARLLGVNRLAFIQMVEYGRFPLRLRV
jgi:hypothetical protein